MQVAVAFTPSQVQDLLHLRCLFYQRLGQLSRQRQHLLHKMPEAGVTSQMTQSQPVKLGFCHTRYRFQQVARTLHMLLKLYNVQLKHR